MLRKLCLKLSIKLLGMHITNQKLSLNIFMVRNLQNIFMEHEENMEKNMEKKS